MWRDQKVGIICAGSGANPPTGSVCEVDVVGATYFGFNLTGTWVGTMVFEVTFDSVNWISIGLPLQGSTTTAAVSSVVSTSASNKTGFWAIPVAAASVLSPNGTPPTGARMRCSTFTSGSPLVRGSASNNNNYITAGILAASEYVSTTSGSNASVSAVAPSSTVHAWAATYIECDFSTTTAVGSSIIVYDGTQAAGTVLLKQNVPTTGNTPFIVTLPKTDAWPNGAVVGTVGNQMTIVLAAAGGSVTGNLNVKFDGA